MQEQVLPAPRNPAPLGTVRAEGWLAERLDRAFVGVSNLLGSLWWPGSCWGYEHPARWLRNVTHYGRYCGYWHPARPEVRAAMLDLVATGKAFANYETHALAAYNEEEFLMGLLACSETGSDPEALAAARRLGESLAANHPRLRDRHYYKGLAIGRLLDLGRTTDDGSFVAAAVAIAEDQQLAVLQQPGGTHGAVAAMIAGFYAELWQTTGEARYLAWAKDIWQAIRERMVITGGLGEVLFFKAPPEESDVHDETCQHAWWLIANLKLWQVTGEDHYLDLAERILYNHLLFAQLHRGEDAGFCALGDIDQGFRGQHNYICCDNEGFHALLALVGFLVTGDPAARELSVNLLAPARVPLTLAGLSAGCLHVATDYPVRGSVRLTVEAGEPVSFRLRVRVPGAVAPAGVYLNGTELPATFRDHYLEIERAWAANDVVTIVFPQTQRVEADDTGAGLRGGRAVIDGRECQAKRLGVFHGPLLAALFRVGHGNDLSWVWTGDYPEVLDSGGCGYSNYPESKPAWRRRGTETWHGGHAVALTEVRAGDHASVLRWTQDLGPDVRIRHEVTVYPGLPVTLDWRERLEGWDGGGRIRCGGIRFATAKHANTRRYGKVSFPYPFPALTTWTDLSAGNRWVAGGGSFSLAEPLRDEQELVKTGVFRLCNGYFRVICHYDAQRVARAVGSVGEHWAGVYLEPGLGGAVTITRRLIFSLAECPLSQDLTRLERERVAAVTWELRRDDAGGLTLVLSGPVVQHTPVVLPRQAELTPGVVLHDERVAVRLTALGDDQVVARLPVPGVYRVR